MAVDQKPENYALPGNPRYQPNSLVGIFGYDNLYIPVAQVELAGLIVLADIGVIPKEEFALLTPEMAERILQIRTSDVDELERKVTKHDIRALVRIIQEILPEALRRWVHVPFTSYDPLETGRILQYAGVHRDVINPKSKGLVGILSGLVRKYADTLQIGRTHGQHAIPITVGFWLATILSRIIYNSMQIDSFASGLVAKISGAVGANNAVVGLGIAEKCGEISFQGRVLSELGLKQAVISTQILPPEPLAYFLYSCLMLSASLGQLGRDCRHLMRSEIAEIGEPFDEGQVGSSTMGQKRNPMTFENIEGTWLRNKSEFGKVLDSMISEHQRDLVGSSLARDFPIMLVNLVVQLDTLLRMDSKTQKTFLERLTVNEENCQKNFKLAASYTLAEPIYIALQMAGYPYDAHELVVRKAMPLSRANNQPLLYSIEGLAGGDKDLAEALVNIPSEVFSLLDKPQNYTGDASEKALEIADLADFYIAGT